ncbi:MAG: transposase [Bacteroides xylanisolvens]
MIMDTTLHNHIFNEFIKSYETRDYPINNKIRNITFDHLDELYKLQEDGIVRDVVIENIERSLLCRTIYLGVDYFECPDCGRETTIPHSCHCRFCNACGITYAKQLAATAVTTCIDVPHRHIVFTIPDSLRNWFRQDRSRLDILFIAARNTISLLMNPKLLKKIKKQKLKNGRYIFENYRDKKEFGAIASLHTFGRDLKWNPHIHMLVAEASYDKKTKKVKRFHHFNFDKLRKTFQFELLRLIEEAVGADSFRREKTILYNRHKEGFYVYARTMEEDSEFSVKNNSKNINACISYCMRYAARPAMAESRIIEYDKANKKVTWFYDDHTDNKRYTVVDKAMDFIKKLILHIPEKGFHNLRHYGFYSNAASSTLDEIHEVLGKNKKPNTKAIRKEERTQLFNKLKYRTNMIDSFNRDPIKCKCGSLMLYNETFNPLKGDSNDSNYRRNCINEMQEMQLRGGGPKMDFGRTLRVRS